MKRLILFLWAIPLFAQYVPTAFNKGAVVTATPGFVGATAKEQVNPTTNPTGQTACPNFKICVGYPELVLSGNAGVVLVQYANTTSVAFTATDDASNTYTCANGSQSAGGEHLWTAYCLALNMTAGAHIVQVSFGSTAVTNASAWPHSFNNIATSSALDGSVGSCVGTSSTTANCTSVTTTAANDLILHFVCRAATPTVTSFTAGSGFTLGVTNILFGCASQFEVKATAGSVTPALTMASASTYTELVIPLKAASAGTAPTGEYVERIMSENTTTTTYNAQFPSAGNFLIMLNACGNTLTGSSVSDSGQTGGAAWAITGASSGNTTSFVSKGAAADTSGLLTLTLTGSGDCTITLISVVGAPATQFVSRATYHQVNASAGATMKLWSDSATGNVLNFLPTPTIGLTFAVASTAINTVNGASAPSSCILDVQTWGGEAQDGPTIPLAGDENNGWMHCPITSYTNNIYNFTVMNSTEGVGQTWSEVVGLFGSTAEAIINGGENQRSTAGSSLAITVPSTTSGTASIVGIADFNSTGRTVSSVCYDGTTCAAGNVFTQCTSCAITSGSNNRTSVWYILSNPSGKTTVTITLNASASQLDGAYLEVQKGTGTFAEDTGGGNVIAGTGNSSAACSGTGTFDCGASITTTGSVDLMVASFNSTNTIKACPQSANEFTWASVIWNSGNDGGFCALLTQTAGAHKPIATDNGSGATFSESSEAIK